MVRLRVWLRWGLPARYGNIQDSAESEAFFSSVFAYLHATWLSFWLLYDLS